MVYDPALSVDRPSKRVKQVARKKTGGAPPRRQIATMAARRKHLRLPFSYIKRSSKQELPAKKPVDPVVGADVADILINVKKNQFEELLEKHKEQNEYIQKIMDNMLNQLDSDYVYDIFEDEGRYVYKGKRVHDEFEDSDWDDSDDEDAVVTYAKYEPLAWFTPGSHKQWNKIKYFARKRETLFALSHALHKYWMLRYKRMDERRGMTYWHIEYDGGLENLLSLFENTTLNFESISLLKRHDMIAFKPEYKVFASSGFRFDLYALMVKLSYKHEMMKQLKELEVEIESLEKALNQKLTERPRINFQESKRDEGWIGNFLGLDDSDDSD